MNASGRQRHEESACTRGREPNPRKRDGNKKHSKRHGSDNSNDHRRRVSDKIPEDSEKRSSRKRFYRNLSRDHGAHTDTDAEPDDRDRRGRLGSVSKRREKSVARLRATSRARSVNRKKALDRIDRERSASRLSRPAFSSETGCSSTTTSIEESESAEWPDNRESGKGGSGSGGPDNRECDNGGSGNGGHVDYDKGFEAGLKQGKWLGWYDGHDQGWEAGHREGDRKGFQMGTRYGKGKSWRNEDQQSDQEGMSSSACGSGGDFIRENCAGPACKENNTLLSSLGRRLSEALIRTSAWCERKEMDSTCVKQQLLGVVRNLPRKTYGKDRGAEEPWGFCHVIAPGKFSPHICCDVHFHRKEIPNGLLSSDVWKSQLLFKKTEGRRLQEGSCVALDVYMDFQNLRVTGINVLVSERVCNFYNIHYKTINGKRDNRFGPSILERVLEWHEEEGKKEGADLNEAQDREAREWDLSEKKSEDARAAALNKDGP